MFEALFSYNREQNINTVEPPSTVTFYVLADDPYILL